MWARETVPWTADAYLPRERVDQHLDSWYPHMLAAVPCVCSCALCLLPGIPGLRMGRLGSPRTNWLARLVGISKLQAQGRMTKEDTTCQLQASKAACALVRRHQKTHEHTHQGKGTWTPQTHTCVKKNQYQQLSLEIL